MTPPITLATLWPAAGPLAGAFPCPPSSHPRHSQNGPQPFVYRRPRRAPPTPRTYTFFAAQTQGYRVSSSADGPCLFQFRVCPRRSPFLILIYRLHHWHSFFSHPCSLATPISYCSTSIPTAMVPESSLFVFLTFGYGQLAATCARSYRSAPPPASATPPPPACCTS